MVERKRNIREKMEIKANQDSKVDKTSSMKEAIRATSSMIEEEIESSNRETMKESFKKTKTLKTMMDTEMIVNWKISIKIFCKYDHYIYDN